MSVAPAKLSSLFLVGPKVRTQHSVSLKPWHDEKNAKKVGTKRDFPRYGRCLICFPTEAEIPYLVSSEHWYDENFLGRGEVYPRDGEAIGKII